MKRFYYDAEACAVISLPELMQSFEIMQADMPEEFNYDFSDYLENCLSKNGALCELSEIFDRKMQELKAARAAGLEPYDHEIRWREAEIREIQRYIEMN